MSFPGPLKCIRGEAWVQKKEGEGRSLSLKAGSEKKEARGVRAGDKGGSVGIEGTESLWLADRGPESKLQTHLCSLCHNKQTAGTPCITVSSAVR